MTSSTQPPHGTRLLAEKRTIGESQIRVWTGHELVVLARSGYRERSRFRNVGAVFDVATARWHDMARVPTDEGLAAVTAGWDGREVVVLGTRCDIDPEALRSESGQDDCRPGTRVTLGYDPARNRWRRLPNPRGTGDYVVSIGYIEDLAVFHFVNDRFAGFDGARSSWVELGPDAQASRVFGASGSCAAEHWGIAWKVVPLNTPTPSDVIRLGVLDVRARQELTFDAPAYLPSRKGLVVTCMKSQAVVSTADLHDFAVLDLNVLRWTRVTPPSVGAPFAAPQALWTGDEIVFWDWEGTRGRRTALAYNWTRAKWRALTTQPRSEPIWVGNRALVLEGDRAGGLTMYEWNE